VRWAFAVDARERADELEGLGVNDYTVKVQEDAFRRAEELAAVLGISEAAALGHLTYLWRWVLTLRPNAAPDGIVRGRAACLRLEAAARWKGKRGDLVEALLELGLVTRERKKMRVKGTKPYADEWRRKDEARSRERERRREKRAALSATEKKTKPSKLEVVKSALPPSEEAMKWWAWAMEQRATDKMKDGYNPFDTPRAYALARKGVPSDSVPPKSFAKWFEDRTHEGILGNQLAWAWLRYLGDEHFESRQWPLAVFMTEGVYRDRITAA
jgi:hypothetical protein